MHLSSSYAKILGETNFGTREIPRSGSKAKDGEKRKKERKRRERLNDGNNNGQAMHGARKPPGQKKKREKDRKLMIAMAKLRMAHPSTHGARKPPGPTLSVIANKNTFIYRQQMLKGSGSENCYRFPVINCRLCKGYICRVVQRINMVL